jgi:hypothetical protein
VTKGILLAATDLVEHKITIDGGLNTIRMPILQREDLIKQDQDLTHYRR